MANTNLFNPPYVKGQWGAPAKSERLVEIWMSIVFFFLPISQMILANRMLNDKAYFVWGGMWLILMLLTFWIESLGRSRFPFLAVDILLFVVTVSGLFGIPNQFFGGRIGYLNSIGFTIFLLIRNVAMFIIMPRTLVANHEELLKIATKWIFRGTVVILVATAIFSQSRGFGLAGGRFAAPDWLHPNTVSIYAGVLMVFVVCTKTLKIPSRLFGGSVALYILLLTQSRTTLAALFIALFIYWVLGLGRNAGRTILASFLTLGVGFIAFLALAPSLSEFAPIKSIIDRTNTTDPTAGRVTKLQYAYDEFQKSPIVGFGYNAGFQVDNFVAKYGTETGVVGLSLYLFFFMAVSVTSYRVYKFAQDEKVRHMGRISLALLVLLFFRSIAEATDLFHLSDILSNATFLICGFCVAATADLAMLGRNKQESVDRFNHSALLANFSEKHAADNQPTD